MLVQYKKTNILRAFGKTHDFLFVPGNNEIPKDVWDDLMTNKNFKRRADDHETFKVVSSVDAGAEVSSLAPFGPAEAKSIVRETYDPALLRQWQKQETRKTVSAVIDEQLKLADMRMAERQKKDEDDEDDDGE